MAIDNLSRFCILVPLNDKQTTSVAKTLIDEVFCKFNTPRTLLSDNGSEFNYQVLEAICFEYGINKTNKLAYKPSGNGLVERQNRKNSEMSSHVSRRRILVLARMDAPSYGFT